MCNRRYLEEKRTVRRMTDKLEEKKVCKICYTASSHKSKQVLTPITKSITDTRGARTCTICKQQWIEITVFRERGQQEWVYVKPRPKISLLSEYQLCTSVEKKLKCPKASKCTFAHSKLELVIWNKERQKDARSAQPTSRLQLCKHIIRGSCPLSNRCMFAHSYEELEKWKTDMTHNNDSSAQSTSASHSSENFYCDVCDTICTSKKQLEEHKKGSRHLSAVYPTSHHPEPYVRNYPSPVIPRHQAAAAKLQQQIQSSKLNNNNATISIRERPKLPFHVLEYRMCRHVQMGRPCLHGDLCTFAHSNEELLAWSRDVGFSSRFERASGTVYHPPGGATDHDQLLTMPGCNDSDASQITDKLYAVEQSSEVIEDVRDRIRNTMATLGLESNHYGIKVNEISGTEMDLTMTEEKMVTWIFEVTFEFPVLLRAVVLLDPLTVDFSIVSIKHTSPSGTIKEVKGPKIKEGIGYTIDLKLSPSEKIKFKVQLKPHVGIMEQVLILDFDKCVISRSMSARLVDQREARLLEYEEGRKASKPKKTDLFWEQHYNIQELDISYGEEADKNLKQYSLPEAIETLIERGEYDNKESEVTKETFDEPSNVVDEPSKDDYKRRMHNLLFIEEYHQRKEMSKYDLYELEVKCAKNISRSDGVFGAPSGYVYIELQMDEELFEGGRTVREHDHALVLPSGQLRAFKGVVESVASSEVVLKISEKVMKPLSTSHNICSVRFVVDRIKFRAMHYAVDNISLDCVFPTKINLQKLITADNQDYSRYLELSCLNSKQRNAIVSILDPSCCKIPSLVCGPFGCGKTRTLRECIVLMLLHQPSAKMLICTHSNSAADLYVEDISKEWNNFKKEKLSLFRLFYTGRRYNTVSHIVRQYSSIHDFTFMVPDISTLSQYSILVTTLVTARLLVLMGLPKGHFTHIFVDEAAQALECEALVPLMLANQSTKIILAGDHMQIDPSVYSPLARKYGLHISLLERLYHAHAYSDGVGKLCKTMLEENHRTHPTILELPSKMFYKNKLKAKARFLSNGPRDMPPLLFVGAEGQETKAEDSPSYYNKYEASKVVDKVHQLIEQKIHAKDICVLAPYMKQVKMIRFLLRKEHLNEVSVRTVDGVQGLEFRTLIISTVRTCSLLGDNEEDAGFLSNPKLFNTAITRAKQWLIIVGHPVTLCTVGSNRQCWLEIIKKCIHLESFEYTDPGKFEKYLDYKMMCRQAIEHKRQMSLSPKPDLASQSIATSEHPSSELFFDEEEEVSSSELISKGLDDIDVESTPPPTAISSTSSVVSTVAITTNDNTVNSATTTATNITTTVEPITSSYSRQPGNPMQQPTQAPTLMTQSNLPTQQAPSVNAQPAMSSQQTVSTHQQQQQLNYSMVQQQQVQSFNPHPSLSQHRQPFPMYQLSQPGIRAQQYMMGQHYMAQPTKLPFIQQHPSQQHIIMAQNSMLQHQMQNASMSVNQHEASHHLVAQHANTVVNEINEIGRILNTEEESLNKLISFFTTQVSLGNVSQMLRDNILQQKVMVDERLKRLQEQKPLFQQFCELYKNQLYQEAQSNPVNYHAVMPNYNIPLAGNLPSTGIQPPSNAAMFPTRTTAENKAAASQSATNLVTPSATNNANMVGSNQNLSAGGSTPSLSGTSEHASENAPIMGVRTMPPGSVPTAFIHQMVDPGSMSQQTNMMYPQMSQMTQLSQFSLSQAQLQPQPECHDLYLSDDEY